MVAVTSNRDRNTWVAGCRLVNWMVVVNPALLQAPPRGVTICSTASNSPPPQAARPTATDRPKAGMFAFMANLLFHHEGLGF